MRNGERAEKRIHVTFRKWSDLGHVVQRAADGFEYEVRRYIFHPCRLPPFWGASLRNRSAEHETGVPGGITGDLRGGTGADHGSQAAALPLLRLKRVSSLLEGNGETLAAGQV